MEKDLDLLDSKVQQLIQFCRNLRQENSKLRSELDQSRAEHRQMATRMTEARQRLETLLQRIPEEE